MAQTATMNQAQLQILDMLSFIKKKALEGVACVTTPMSGVCDMRHKGKK